MLRNRNSLRLEVIRTILSAALRAAKPGKHNGMETMVMTTDRDGRCARQCVPSVARIAKYRSSPVKSDRSIEVIATMPSGRTDKASVSKRTYLGRDYLDQVCQ